MLHVEGKKTNSLNFMEWSSGEFVADGSIFHKMKNIIHSTPYNRCPLPTESPNVSRINGPSHYDMLELIKRFEEMSLN